MKLSTRGRYGTRAILDIALHATGGDPVPLKDIADRQQISKKYLEQFMGRLESDGLVRSIRGAGGGFVLARPADRITLLDIVTALEGPLALVDCIDHPKRCSRSPSCATRDLWGDMTAQMTDFLRSQTLADLCERQRSKELVGATAYEI